MNINAQINELIEQGNAASARDQERHAALLYERARVLAIDSGDHVRAFTIGAAAVDALSRAGESQRHITLLLDLLHEIPDGADIKAVYSARRSYFYYLLEDDKTPRLDKIVACTKELDDMCRSIGKHNSNEIPGRQAFIFRKRGMWQEAVTQCEIAFSRSTKEGSSDYLTATRAAVSLLQLGRSAEAQRWLSHITSAEWPHTAKINSTYVRLLIALHDNDAVARKGAILAADDALAGAQWETYIADNIYVTVAGLVHDEDLGDPVAPTHPATVRLAEFPKNQQGDLYLAGLLHGTRIVRQIAGLRYAAGIAPVDDYYYRKPHQLQPRDAAQLPEEIPARVAASRKACDDALPLAIHMDTGFQCTFRQDEIRSWRARVDEIAAVYGL